MQRIYLSGLVGEDITLNVLRAQLPKAGDIAVHINSYGGDVTEGWAIYDELRGYGRNNKVMTVNDGVCASMASVIFLAGSERVMRPNSKLMIHNPWGMATGDAKEIEQYANYIKAEEERMSRFYSKETGISLDDVSAMMDRETWMDSEEAIEKGFATGLEQLKAVAKFNHNTEMKENFNEEERSWFKSQFEALAKLFKKHDVKAMVTLTVVTEDGDLPIYVDSEDGEIEGKMAYIDEGMTEPAPEGMHRLQDGREITVNAEGMIDSVREEGDADAEAMEEDEEMKAMREELEALKAENEELKNGMKEKADGLAEAMAYVNKVKSLVEGNLEKPATKGDSKKSNSATKVEDSDISPMDAYLNKLRNK